MMKRLLLLLSAGMFLFGCASLSESEFLKHDSMFKNNDHMRFSLFGYKNPTAETQKQSEEEGWWGTKVPYIPAK